MNKTIFLGITIGVIAVAMISTGAVSKLVMARTPSAPTGANCTSDFFTERCCWFQRAQDPQGGKYLVPVCETCISGGDGTYYQCKTVAERTGAAQDPCAPRGCVPGGIFDTIPTPGPAAQDTPTGGIFQGDIISTPGPGAQDTPSTTQGGIFQGGLGWYQETPTAAQDTPTGGIFQGNLLGLYSQQGLIQSDPESETPPETNTTQPGGTFREDLEQLGATQDNETTSEDGVTEELPAPEENMTTVPSATEETQPALVQEEPVPTCPEGQVLDEETNLCVLEEPEADEPEQEEAEEEPSSEEEDEN